MLAWQSALSWEANLLALEQPNREARSKGKLSFWGKLEIDQVEWLETGRRQRREPFAKWVKGAHVNAVTMLFMTQFPRRRKTPIERCHGWWEEWDAGDSKFLFLCLELPPPRSPPAENTFLCDFWVMLAEGARIRYRWCFFCADAEIITSQRTFDYNHKICWIIFTVANARSPPRNNCLSSTMTPGAQKGGLVNVAGSHCCWNMPTLPAPKSQWNSNLWRFLRPALRRFPINLTIVVAKKTSQPRVDL